MKNKKLKQEKGFAGSDALIAILIISLFAGLIATISYNIYLSNSSIKRMSKATEYIVDMFEYIDKAYYDEVTKENLTKYFNDKYYYQEDGVTVKSDPEVKIQEQEEEVNTPFKAQINIVKFNETEGNKDKLDLVEEITMTISYKLGNKDQRIEMKKTKTRENLETPNAPDLALLELEEGNKIYPIKKTNNTWKVCNQDDTGWYNYEIGNWALIIETDKELKIDDEVDTKNLSANEKIYAWIPRYAYDSTNKKLIFLFSNSNKYIDEIDGYNDVVEIDKSLYTIPNDFSNSQGEYIGKWVNESSEEIYQILNNVYPLEND